MDRKNVLGLLYNPGVKIIDRKNVLKAMDDIGLVMTPFGDVVTVTLVVNSYV